MQQADVVVTMGCGETCPVFPGKTYEDWPLEDPKGQDLDTVRRTVDQVDQRVRDLLARLPEPSAGAGPARKDGHYRRNVRSSAHPAHLRHTNTPGVLPSSAALERGTSRPQQPQATVPAAGRVTARS